MLKTRFSFPVFLFLVQALCFSLHGAAQEVIDIVDPYEMKASRSKQADTFYFTQHTAALSKAGVDTLRTYDVFLEERPTPFGKAYMCNGREVTKKKYDEYKLFWNASGACKPCLLYTYDDQDKLKYVAYQYEDCLCGSYTEFYPEGGKKVEGQFRPNTSGSWLNMKGRDLCNKRDGVWTYYDNNGLITKTETYVDGKLKSVSEPTLNSSSGSDPQTPDNASSGEQSRKGWLQRMKDKNSGGN